MFYKIMITSIFLLTLSNPSFAQQISVPENGKINVYGSGWDCQRGFKKSGDTCVKVDVPLNGKINVYGNGWDCQRGFKKIGSLCKKVVTTENTKPTYPSIATATPRQSDITLPSSTEQFVLRTKRVQQGLTEYGYYNGKIDGKAGPETKAALSKFQKDFSFTITGTITPEILDAFGIT